jgi:hypothetical protein
MFYVPTVTNPDCTPTTLGCAAMHDGHDIGLGQATTGVQIVAKRTSRRIDEVSQAIHHVILREVDELGGDQHLVEILHNSVSANVSTIVHALRYAIDAAHYEVPVVAAEYARRLAQHNVPLEALIRAYRLGQTDFLRIAFDEAYAVETNAAASLVLAQQIMDKTAEYIDWVTERVIRAYSLEHERWIIQRNVVRSRHIRRLLEGKDPESDAPDAAIEFPVRLRHIAVIAWMDAVSAEAPRSAAAADSASVALRPPATSFASGPHELALRARCFRRHAGIGTISRPAPAQQRARLPSGGAGCLRCSRI